ncbi:MAG TPA: polyprenol monophosphomannose synthase, partial [Alphaproteobacteria bacterium]|nr:polyprenol monophosphomannose synthase [Alphaproteobacteria bacterium]
EDENEESFERHRDSEYADTKLNYHENTVSLYYKSSPDIEVSHSDIKNTDIAENHGEVKYERPTAVCIVTPTYNEAKNITKLLDLIYSKEHLKKYDEKKIIMNVLVVDDNSPDGTADIVKEYRKNNPNVHLLSRMEKNGLGAAYISGMHHAIKTLEPDIIFEMDADLSHNPKYIIPMIEKIRQGADFVIGSRYIKGGSIPKNWGIKRRILSKSANLYAKTLLGIKDVNDCTGGFRAIRSSALQMIDFNSLKTKGYAFQISLLEEMRKNNVAMAEVPIAFKDRTNGTSKMRLYDIFEEGIFVLKTSLQNMFYPQKKSAQKTHAEIWFSDQAKNLNSSSVETSGRSSHINDDNYEDIARIQG